MIIAGNCLMTDSIDADIAKETARQLKERQLADYFRCKIWGGGTSPLKYQPGIGYKGIELLEDISVNILPAGTEVQTPKQVWEVENLSFIWIGARNCQNYALLESTRNFKGTVFVKRGFGMTIEEVVGLYEIFESIIKRPVYIVERGIDTFDRLPDSRWSPDLKGMIRIKHERPDIFDRMVVDCSHSVGHKEWSGDVYRAFKAIGVNHFMFECSSQPKISRTDTEQILSIDELEGIIKG